MSGLDGGRLNIAACSIGAANACLTIVLNHFKVQKMLASIELKYEIIITMFSTRIPTQTESFLIADMFGKIHTGRMITRQGCCSAL